MEETIESAGTNSAKRARDESDESLEAKRLRAADQILLDILEDVDSADRNLADPADSRDLAIVLKSFEEEIAALPPQHLSQQAEDVKSQPPVSTSTSDSDDPRQSDLYYLLEASDYELGLPPTVPSSDEGEVTEADLGKEVLGAVGFGQIWGLDDEIQSYYDALGFGGFGAFGQVEDRAATGGGDGVVFDGGLFEYPDPASAGAADFSDSSWLPESLPAV